MIKWKKGNNLSLSKFFNSKEFENRKDSNYKIDAELLCRLYMLRKEFGAPIIITSGFRSEEYNKEIGGATKSQHVLGKAADIRPGNFSKKELNRLYELCKKHFKAIGDGRHKGFIHVDIRDDKIRRWEY